MSHWSWHSGISGGTTTWGNFDFEVDFVEGFVEDSDENLKGGTSRAWHDIEEKLLFDRNPLTIDISEWRLTSAESGSKKMWNKVPSKSNGIEFSFRIQYKTLHAALEFNFNLEAICAKKSKLKKMCNSEG